MSLLSTRQGRVMRACVVIAAIVLPGACASRTPPAPSKWAPPSQDVHVPEPAPDSPGAAGSGPLTLDAALARATARNAALAALRLEADARAADTAQASRAPNPAVEVSVEDLGGTGTGVAPSQTTVLMSQRLELGGRRGLRVEMGTLNQALALWDYELARREIESRVASAFVGALAADEARALASAEAAIAEEIAAAVDARVEAGFAAPPEADRVHAAAAVSRIEASRAEQQRISARAQLTSAWNGTPAEAAELSGALPGITASEVGPLSDLLNSIERSPRLARWDAEIARRELAIRAERAAGVPDLDVGVGYRRLHERGEHALVVQGRIDLPFADRRRDAVKAAELRAASARSERDAAATSLRADAVQAHAEATAALAALRELNDAVVPRSARAYEATFEGYRAGKFSLLDVLDARRVLNTALQRRLEARAALARALIVIAQLAGDSPAIAVTRGDR